MGWETAAVAGFQLLNAGNQIGQGKAEAQARLREGEYRAKNLAEDTARNIGKLQTSFLQSGIALDDVGGTQTVFRLAAEKGYTDITRTLDNADAEAKNAYSKARTAALDGLLKGGFGKIAGAAGSSASNWFGDQAGYAINDMGYGNTAYNMFEQSDLDPSPNSAWSF